MSVEKQLEEMQETLRVMDSKMNFILGVALKDYRNPYKMNNEEIEKETEKLNEESKVVDEAIETEQKEMIEALEEEEKQVSLLLTKLIENNEMGIEDLSEEEKEFIFPYYAEFKQRLGESDVENEVRERVNNILMEVLVA